MGFQLPCIPALFRVSDTFFLLPPTCFLILRQQVWVSSPPQPQLLQASAVPYPDSLDGDSLCPSLACSLNAAYTSVSIPFIQISLLSHLRDRTLTDGMSLSGIPGSSLCLPCAQFNVYSSRDVSHLRACAASFAWVVLPHPFYLAKSLLPILHVAMYLKWFVHHYPMNIWH